MASGGGDRVTLGLVAKDPRLRCRCKGETGLGQCVLTATAEDGLCTACRIEKCYEVDEAWIEDVEVTLRTLEDRILDMVKEVEDGNS